MKVLITGARGMLGSDLTEVFTKALGGDSVLPKGSLDLDITDAQQVISVLNEFKPDVVINSAAYTNVDKAESEKQKATAVNATGPGLMAAECGKRQIRLVHFSTDQVFDGSGSVPRKETDTPRPLNHYALSKWEGEKLVLSHPGHLVLRVQWLYGKKKDRFSQLRSKEVFTPFLDQYGAPAWTLPLSSVVLKLAREKTTGLYHYSYDDYASWFEVYQFVCQQWNLPTKLIGKRTAEVALPAIRPLFSVLDNRKLLSALKIPRMGSWREPLSEFLRLPHS